MTAPDHEILIVGAGFSGIGAAIGFDAGGFTDWRILEDGGGVGGTWYWNTYPGVAVDIPSFSYQFSFAQRTDWSRSYAPGHELRCYAEDLVDSYGLRARIRFGSRVVRATYREDDRIWCLELANGDHLTARFLVNGSGVLTTPKKPDIAGLDTFGGVTVHTARWNHDLDLTGKRVAVIGTGASAVQLIPEIAGRVAELTVFQRTPIWCFPKPDVPLSGLVSWGLKLPGARTAVRAASQAFVEVTFALAAQYNSWYPLADRMEGVGYWWLRRQVRDPDVRGKLTPAYGAGCKRASFHNSYLATYNRDNVRLVTETIREVTETGVRTDDNRLHEIDVLILATGFKVMESDNIPTYDLVGISGETLEKFWDENRLQAYEGVSVPGYPNFFTVFGPYGYTGSSYFALVEAQTHHILRCMKEARRRNANRIEIRAAANERFFASMMRRRHRQVFWRESCAASRSYYFDKHGDVGLRPTSTLEAVLRSRRYSLDDYAYQ